MTLQTFLKSKKIEKITSEKISWWVKEKKNYLKTKIDKIRENTDKELEDKLSVCVNKLLEWKVNILNTLLDRVDTIKEFSNDKTKYTWFITQELISINNVIKTELWEASEIKKLESGDWWFSIVIIPK